MGAGRCLAVLALALFASVLVSAISPDPKPASVQQYASSNGVNLYTGDLGVGIPLLTVPGRGGLDYPISLRYSAGIQADQPASPVGLGWSLSTGAVTRDVEGIADDSCASCFDAVNYAYLHKQPNPNQPAKESWGSRFMASMALTAITLSIAPPGASHAPINQFLGASAVAGGMNSVLNNPRFSDVYGDNDPDVYHKRKLDGFSWRGMGGSGVLSGLDYNSPDVYTLSGDYASGRLMLLEPKNTYDHLIFHLQKPGGHTTAIEDNSNCNPEDGFVHNCRDTYYVYAERSALDKGRYNAFRVFSPDGTRYAYEPTEWVTDSNGGDAVADSDFSKRIESNDGDSCDQDSRKYLKTDFKWKYATVFGLKRIESYDGSNYVDFSYTTPTSQDILRIRSPYNDWNFAGDPSKCVTGPNGRKTWSESFKQFSYVNRIDTPTHYALFDYAGDRRDAKEWGGSKRPKRLASISLYYKGSGGDRLLQKIRFNYNYDLAVGSPDSDAGYGKLALESVSIYYGNEGAEGTYWGSYGFQYANGDAPGTGKNPSWSLHKRDRWGYYCGNCVQGNYNLNGANTAAMDLRPDAWSLSRITWPTGGTTEYFYESDRYTKLNSWYPSAVPSLNMEKDDTHYGGGVRVERVRSCDGLGGCYATKYLYNKKGFDMTFFGLSEDDGYNQPNTPGESSGVATNEPMPFTYSHGSDDRLFFGSPQTAAYVGYGLVTEVPGFDEAHDSAPFGYVIHNFTTAWEYPNTGGVEGASIATSWNNKKIGSSSLQQTNVFENEVRSELSFRYCPTLVTAPWGTRIEAVFTCEQYFCGVGDTTLNQPDNECGWDGQNACVSMSGAGLDYGSFGDPVRVTLVIDHHTPSDLTSEHVNNLNIDTCCPDADNNEICDIMEVPVGRRFSGSKDNESMRGLEVETKFYSLGGALVRKIERGFSQYAETNPAGLRDIFAKWTKLDWEYVEENGVGVNKTLEYSGQSALAGAPFQTTVTGSEGEKLIETTRFAFQEYPAMVEITPSEFHHLYSPAYMTRVDKNAYNEDIDGNTWAVQITEYGKYGNDAQGNPIWDGSGANDYRPRYGYSWQKNDSIYSPILTKEYAAYDDYGHVTRYYDATRNLFKTWYKDNDFPCGEALNAPQLHYALPTCYENPVGRQVKYAYNGAGFLWKTTDENQKVTEYAYDGLNRLYREIPPTPSGTGTPYWTKQYEYYLAGASLSPSNLNYVKTTSVVDSARGIQSVSYAKADGLGRNFLSVLEAPGPDIVTQTTYNGLGLPGRSYIPRFDDVPLGSAKYVEAIYNSDPRSQVHYSVPVGVSPTWTSVGSFSKSIYSEGTIQTLLLNDVPKAGYYEVSCDVNPRGPYPYSGWAALYDGSAAAADNTDPAVFRCDALTYTGSAYVYLRPNRYYLLEAYFQGDGSLQIDVGNRYLPNYAAYSEQSHSHTGAPKDYRYFLDIGFDEAGNITISKIDKLGRVVEDKRILESGEAITGYAYDILGRKTAVTSPGTTLNPGGLTTSLTYDRLGRVRQVTSPDAGTELLEYDNNGNVVKRTRNGLLTSFSYDALNRLLSADYPDDSYNEYYTYDEPSISTSASVGHLHFVNGPAVIREFDYDNRGQVSKERTFFQGTCRSGATSYPSGCPDVDGDGFVGTGDLVQALALLTLICPTAPCSSSGETQVQSSDYRYTPFLDFDRDGFVVDSEAQSFRDAFLRSVSQRSYALSFAYDDEGHRKRTTYPNGFAWDNEYDYASRVETSKPAAGNARIGYTYTADALPLYESLTGDGSSAVVTSYAYNARNLLETNQVVKTGGSEPYLQEAYEYDPAGNVKSLYVGQAVGQQKAADFQYDEFHQLTGASSPPVLYKGQTINYYGGDSSFVYDASGNRDSSLVNGVAYDYQYYSGTNRLQNDGQCSYSYYADGSVSTQTCGTQTTTFYYDYDQRLEKVVHPDGTCEKYFYDEAGNRVKKLERLRKTGYPDWTEGTYYVYDGNKLAQEVTRIPETQLVC